MKKGGIIIKKNDRKSKLLEIVENDIRFIFLIEDMVFLEEELSKLRKELKEDSSKNKRKRYNESLSQYINVVKCLAKVTNIESEDDKSSLGIFFEELKKNGLDKDAVHSR